VARDHIVRTRFKAAREALAAARQLDPADARCDAYQAVIDESDCIFLALRPQIDPHVIAELEFRPEQIVVSLIAAKKCQDLLPLVKPVKALVRACPLPPVAQHVGPIAMFPHEPSVGSLFGTIGTPVIVSEERYLDVLWALTALIAPYYALLDTMIQWAEKEGVDSRVTSLYVPSMFQALSAVAEATPPGRLSDLIRGSATPEGLNEQALTQLGAKGFYDAVSSALESAHARLKEGFTYRGLW
jgi:pyrroline-5-carboxylate reductase